MQNNKICDVNVFKGQSTSNPLQILKDQMPQRNVLLCLIMTYPNELIYTTI